MERLEIAIPSPSSKAYSQVPADSPASFASSPAHQAVVADGAATPSPTESPRQPRNTIILSSTPPRQKRWQVLPGRNRFMCDGRIVMSRSSGMFLLTNGLLFTVNGLFFTLDCPYLVEKVSPVVPAIAALLFFFVMANLGRAAFSDPGGELVCFGESLRSEITRRVSFCVERKREIPSTGGSGQRR